MALTDLTGTTWTLNDALNSYAGGSHSLKTYNVNITTDTALPIYDGDASTFVVFGVGYDGGGERNVAWLYTSTTTSYMNRASLATGHDTKSLPDTWASGKFSGTFTITGGTDATNSDLIAWIEDNCTSVTPPTPDVVVTYDGDNIVELSEAGTKTLKTAGKYLTDDVVLTYSGGSGGGGGATLYKIENNGSRSAPDTITIDGTTYDEDFSNVRMGYAPAGATVSFCYDYNSDWALDKVVITGSSTQVPVTTRTTKYSGYTVYMFTMPDADVTINSYFND